MGSFASTSVILGSLVFGKSGCSGILFETFTDCSLLGFGSFEIIFAFNASASFFSSAFKDLAFLSFT